MRLAVLADIHGHLQALAAVLADARRHGVDRYVVLGDSVNRFVQPRGVLERLAGLEADWVHGNSDLFVAGYGRPGWRYDWSGARTIARWHRRRIGDSWSRRLLNLPDHRILRLPGLAPILATHALPGDPYRGILPEELAGRVEAGEPLPPWAAPPERVRQVLASFPTPLVLTGHTHRAGVRTVAGRRVLNPGAVMGLMRGDLRAEYMLLTFDREGAWQARWRAVPYDLAATLATLEPLVATLPHLGRLASRVRQALAVTDAAAGRQEPATFLSEERPA